MKANKHMFSNTNTSFFTPSSKLTNNDEICQILRKTKKLVSQDYKYSNYLDKSSHLKLPELIQPKETSENSKPVRLTTINAFSNILTSNNIIVIKHNKKKTYDNEEDTFKTTNSNMNTQLLHFPRRIKFSNFGSYSFEMMNSIELYINKPLDNFDPKITPQIVKELLKEKINYYKKREITDKKTYFNKVFNEATNSHIEITIKSINIIFQVLNKKTNIQQTVHEFMLPIEFLPIFYAIDESTFLKFLAFFVEIDLEFLLKDSVFNYQNFNYMLNNFAEFELDKVGNPVNHKKVFKFSWLTKNNVFDVIVKSPLIEVHLKSCDIFITNFVETELLLSLISKKFHNWEYYSLNHLNQKKTFRSIVNKSFSKISEKKNLNKKFFLDNQRDLHINYIRDTDDSFNLIYTKENESQNIFITFKSYVIDTFYLSKEKKIHLSFKQMSILERMKRIYNDINLLIRKLIICDDSGITVNNDYFTNFNEKSLLFYYKSFPQINTSQANFNLTINHPIITTRQLINNTELFTHEIQVESDILLLLSKENVDKWKYIFFKMKGKYIEISEKLRNEHLRIRNESREGNGDEKVMPKVLSKD